MSVIDAGVEGEAGFRVPAQAYLKDLQALVRRTEDDLRERSGALPEPEFDSCGPF